MRPPTHHLALALFIVALVAAYWRAPALSITEFSPPAKAVASSLPAQFASEMLPEQEGAASHPNLTELPDGRIAAAWLSSKGEAQVIHFSVLDRDGWRQPVPIASRESTAGGAFAYVNQIGQPVLHAEGSWLHLWYVSSTLGPSINHSLSTDGGKSWANPSRLQTSPLANFGGEVRTPPIALADGGLGLPISHHFIGQHGEWLRLAATGQILDKVRLPSAEGALQPAIVVLSEKRALAVLRNAGSVPGFVHAATTLDGGQVWQEGAAPPIPNPNSAVALLRLRSGRLLLAGNPAAGTQTLQLWLSADEGKNWQVSRRIEFAPDGGAEFTNPALLLGRDGRIHLAYDWRRQGIKYAVLTEAWLDEEAP